MDQISRAALAGELASELQAILGRLDALDLYLTAAKVSSALDALAEEAGIPCADETVELPMSPDEKLTRSS
jgi:hypothetical protein